MCCVLSCVVTLWEMLLKEVLDFEMLLSNFIAYKMHSV